MHRCGVRFQLTFFLWFFICVHTGRWQDHQNNYDDSKENDDDNHKYNDLDVGRRERGVNSEYTITGLLACHIFNKGKRNVFPLKIFYIYFTSSSDLRVLSDVWKITNRWTALVKQNNFPLIWFLGGVYQFKIKTWYSADFPAVISLVCCTTSKKENKVSFFRFLLKLVNPYCITHFF